MKTRFIPSWEELKRARKVHVLNKATGGTAEFVSSRLLINVARYAQRYEDSVSIPKEWYENRDVNKAQYEKWYNDYLWNREPHFTQLIIEGYNDRQESPLSHIVWDILKGEEEDD